ncbi:MAG: LysR substrate-binding domain-containing protein [Hyphomicrobiales bacterium]|nr:LysR substrate-binding domain-containing protein [Hyphomicrobiales bacterium]
MDVRQLRYFQRIVERKSFSEASRHLRIAQPALGLQVRQLEDELGVKLLNRHARGVTPTEAGQLLYEHAGIILRQIERAKHEIADIAASPRGKVAIGLTPTVSLILGATLVEKYHEACPNVSLRIAEGLSEVLVEWVASDRLDLAFTYNPSSTRGLLLEPLLTEDLFVIGPPDGITAGRDTVPFAALSKLPLVLPSAPYMLRHLVEEAANRSNIELQIYLEIDSVQTMKELAEHKVCYTVLPMGAVRSEVVDKRLAASRIVEPDLVRTLYVVHARRRPTSKAFAILNDLIRQQVKREIAGGSWSWWPVVKTDKRPARGRRRAGAAVAAHQG